MRGQAVIRLYMIRFFGALVLFAGAAGFARGGALSVGNAWLRAEADAAGRVSLFRKGAGAPFARFSLPAGRVEKSGGGLSVTADGRRISISAHGRLPFLLIRLAPAPGAGRIVRTLPLPEILLGGAYRPDKTAALGTAGLTAVDGHRGSYMFLALADPRSRAGVVAAWLTAVKASGIVFSGLSEGKDRIVVRAESQYGRYETPAVPAGDEGEIFAIGAFDDCRIGLERYADAVADHFRIRLPPQPAGYCTWYSDAFGGSGTEESARRFADIAAEKLVPYGFSFYQIDDHWQSGVKTNGPAKNFTTHNPKGPFPSGMKATADYLASKGIRPGIWFMPFSGTFNAPWYADKQAWFVRSAVDYPPPGGKNRRKFKIDQKKGAPYETFWGGTSLDMTDPAVADYLTREAARIGKEWGYSYFKLDGLWTAMACEQLYVNDGYRPDDLGLQLFDDPRATNVGAFRTGLRRVRDAAGPGLFILGCNVSQNMRTMGASYGLVDAMRIGPDNGPSWKRIRSGPVRGSSRYFYNGRVWYNDPDPVYVRDSIPLSRARLITSWVAVSGQLYAFSDWLPKLSDERVRVLQKTLAPFPCADFRRPEDLFESRLARIWHVGAGGRHVFGLFNWNENEPAVIREDAGRIGLDPGAVYAGFDFWAGRFIPPFKGRFEAELPGGSCRVISVRKWEGRPMLVGTSRHVLSPAFEVRGESWDAGGKRLSGRAAVVAGDAYELYIAMPEGCAAVRAEMDGAAAAVSSDGRNARVRGTPEKSGEIAWSVSFADRPAADGSR